MRAAHLHIADRTRPLRGKAATQVSRAVIALALAAAFLRPVPTRAAPPCRVTVVGGFAFGTYDVFAGTPLTSAVTVQLQCPGSLAPRITMSKGNSSTYMPRTMVSGANTLQYNIYLDAAYKQVWGDLTEGTLDWEPGKQNATTMAYGLVAGGQDPAAGSYSDTIVVTLYP